MEGIPGPSKSPIKHIAALDVEEDEDDNWFFARGSVISPKVVSALYEYAKITNANENKIR